jgi:hypothetical protein
MQQRERKQMAEIFTEAFTGDIIEIRMREKELRQQEMMQDAFQEVMIPLNSDEISSPQLASDKGSRIGLRKEICDGAEVSPF